jgi:hypothetical protein
MDPEEKAVDLGNLKGEKAKNTCGVLGTCMH